MMVCVVGEGWFSEYVLLDTKSSAYLFAEDEALREQRCRIKGTISGTKYSETQRRISDSGKNNLSTRDGKLM
jgi:hypothetical protein